MDIFEPLSVDILNQLCHHVVWVFPKKLVYILIPEKNNVSTNFDSIISDRQPYIQSSSRRVKMRQGRTLSRVSKCVHSNHKLCVKLNYRRSILLPPSYPSRWMVDTVKQVWISIGRQFCIHCFQVSILNTSIQVKENDLSDCSIFPWRYVCTQQLKMFC